MILFQDSKCHIKNKNDRNRDCSFYLIKSADDLLNTQNNKIFLDKIKILIKNTEYFDSFYLSVIKKFAEFVQEIPKNEQGPFSQQTDFLSHALERVSRVLSLCVKYFFSKKGDFYKVSVHEALWIYATFTAALFLDVGKIAVKYAIMLYHKKSYPLKKWVLHNGSMLDQGSYYKVNYIKENFDNLRYFLTPMLARQILDSVEPCFKKGYNWIACDPIILENWFNLLSGEEERVPMTSFMSMIPRAEIGMMEDYRKKNKISLLNPAGEEFLIWLCKQIQENKINIKSADDKLYINGKDIIFSSDLFKQFASFNTLYKHPDIIEEQFINIAKLYQISISELDQRNRAQGGISGSSDISKRYRAAGGIITAHNSEESSCKFFKSGIKLFTLITTFSSHKTKISAIIRKDILKPSLFPNSTS